jgi:hypothetical protein
MGADCRLKSEANGIKLGPELLLSCKKIYASKLKKLLQCYQ